MSAIIDRLKELDGKRVFMSVVTDEYDRTLYDRTWVRISWPYIYLENFDKIVHVNSIRSFTEINI